MIYGQVSSKGIIVKNHWQLDYHGIAQGNQMARDESPNTWEWEKRPTREHKTHNTTAPRISNQADQHIS